MENENELPEKFSDDEAEQLRIENEILRLKLKAELGGEIEGIEGTEGLPPEVENLFLKNILSFEHQYDQVELQTIYQILHEPNYSKLVDLQDEEIEDALEGVLELLKANQIAVDFRGEYSPKEKYRFITEDLFNYQTKLVQIEGMITHYCYEEFYPNHELDIEEQTKEFINHWFEMNFEENNWELADELLTNEQKIVSKEIVLQKFNNIFASFNFFENIEFTIQAIEFQLNDDQKTGLGHAEGVVRFTAVLENNEHLQVNEPFKLYFQYINNNWQIFFFYWPFFKWN